MAGDTLDGAGGLLSDWAVWAEGTHAPARKDAPGADKPRQAARPEADEAVSALKIRNELLERENELLRQRLSIADRQVEVKDSQINDFKAITENLSRQNQVLLMLAQGVPMERILKNDGREIEVRPGHAPRTGESAGHAGGRIQPVGTRRELITSRLRALAGSGMTQKRMAQTLNEEGTPTLSGVGTWDRRKIGKALNILIKQRF